ncbi:MAG: Sua5/YciO/YrdC/YwlC family protein [Chitinophagia bacterium]|nr:Sua5/YciO/YrdC/YwlC family protein [Chitinophagia bacterium]
MVDFEDDIKAAVAVLQSGGILLYPTDTVWGLGCDATNPDAVGKIFALKNRPPEKSLIVLLADARDLLQYVAAPPPDVIAMVEAFDQPTTVVYPQAVELAHNVLHPDGSAAIRVTADPFCKALIKRFRKPLVSTSANVSGKSAPTIFNEIDVAIMEGAQYVVQYRQNDTVARKPSRLVRMNDEGEITVIRY